MHACSNERALFVQRGLFAFFARRGRNICPIIGAAMKSMALYFPNIVQFERVVFERLSHADIFTMFGN
jgi:hypothetical protein